MKNAAYCVFETPLGACGIAWRAAADSDSQAVVTAVQLPEATPQATESRIARKSGASQPGVPPREIEEAIRKIPTGQSRTYGEIAKAVGQPGAAQEVGQAMAKNPIPIIVPCHRVAAAGGKPGGFSAHGGRATKAKLLALEGAAVNLPLFS